MSNVLRLFINKLLMLGHICFEGTILRRNTVQIGRFWFPYGAFHSRKMFVDIMGAILITPECTFTYLFVYYLGPGNYPKNQSKNQVVDIFRYFIRLRGKSLSLVKFRLR